MKIRGSFSFKLQAVIGYKTLNKSKIKLKIKSKIKSKTLKWAVKTDINGPFSEICKN